MSHSEYFRLGLIGWPIEHSYSPVLHLAALKYLNLKGEYELYPIRPIGEDKSKLEEVILMMAAGELHGLNVTIPHKLSVIPFLDTLTPVAEAVGAVNTIKVQGGKLIGDNTDALGLLNDLRRFLAKNRARINGQTRTALVLGAGGSARAVCWALIEDGWQVTLAARRIEQAEKLVDALSAQPFAVPKLAKISSVHLAESGLAALSPDLIVNATPVGMVPDLNRSPWPAGLPFPQTAAVYDLIYNPQETRLIQQARYAGLLTESGIGMLIEQAALSFYSWTGCRVLTSVMQSAYNSVIAANSSA